DADGRPDLLGLRRAANGDVVALGERYDFARPLLQVVENGIGLSVKISYSTIVGALAQTPYGHASLVVSRVSGTTLNASSTPVISAYKYSNARWSQRTREFLGFESLEVTEGSTVTATTYGQQTDACALRATAVVVRNPTEVFWADTFKYLDNSTQAPNAPWICEVQSRQHEDCEGRTACRTSNAETRSYDTFGNL